MARRRDRQADGNPRCRAVPARWAEDQGRRANKLAGPHRADCHGPRRTGQPRVHPRVPGLPARLRQRQRDPGPALPAIQGPHASRLAPVGLVRSVPRDRKTTTRGSFSSTSLLHGADADQHPARARLAVAQLPERADPVPGRPCGPGAGPDSRAARPGPCLPLDQAGRPGPEHSAGRPTGPQLTVPLPGSVHWRRRLRPLHASPACL